MLVVAASAEGIPCAKRGRVMLGAVRADAPVTGIIHRNVDIMPRREILMTAASAHEISMCEFHRALNDTYVEV